MRSLCVVLLVLVFAPLVFCCNDDIYEHLTLKLSSDSVKPGNLATWTDTNTINPMQPHNAQANQIDGYTPSITAIPNILSSSPIVSFRNGSYMYVNPVPTMTPLTDLFIDRTIFIVTRVDQYRNASQPTQGIFSLFNQQSNVTALQQCNGMEVTYNTKTKAIEVNTATGRLAPCSTSGSVCYRGLLYGDHIELSAPLRDVDYTPVSSDGHAYVIIEIVYETHGMVGPNAIGNATLKINGVEGTTWKWVFTAAAMGSINSYLVSALDDGPVNKTAWQWLPRHVKSVSDNDVAYFAVYNQVLERSQRNEQGWNLQQQYRITTSTYVDPSIVPSVPSAESTTSIVVHSSIFIALVSIVAGLSIVSIILLYFVCRQRSDQTQYRLQQS